MEYANAAYKTAGLSANEYMETVTGFSASLISSLGGDTEKAAKYQDMPNTEMSDNASKKRKLKAKLENAYSGLAKHNYTMIENLQREDLNPIEEANGYKVLMSEYGLTQEEVAQRVGKSRPAVANALRLLALPDPVHLLLEEGKLSAGHARAILAVPSGELQKKLAQKVIAEELSVRQTEALAKRLAAEPREAAEPKSAAGPDLSIYLREAEKTLATRFGRKVHIINGRKKGKIELEYYNPEDLNTLLELLEQLPSAGKGGGSL